MSLKAGGTHNAVSFSGLCAEALKANILLGRALVGTPTATFLPGEKNVLQQFKARMLRGGRGGFRVRERGLSRRS